MDKPPTHLLRRGGEDMPSLHRKFPNEILALVLELAHEQFYYGQYRDYISLFRVEAAITQVCRLWRSLGLSIPGLWSTFRVKKPHRDRVAKEFERLQAYLCRSLDKDLDLFFDYAGLRAKEPLLMDMLFLLTPHIHRFKRFVLLSDAVNFVMPFHKAFIGVSAPRLEHFEVCTGKYHDISVEGFDGQPHWDPKILTEGPANIKYLRLDSSGSARFRPPFTNLVHFSFEAGLAQIELYLLWVCLVQVLSIPSLETFSLWDDVIAFPNVATDPLRRIEAKRLKHVRIGKTWANAALFYILHYVTAPLLESLTIACIDLLAQHSLPLTDEANSDLYAFPSLKSLYLLGVDLEFSPSPPTGNEMLFFKQIASKTSKIEHLSITTYEDVHHSGILEALQGRHAGKGHNMAGFWPDVRELDLNMKREAMGKGETAPAKLLQFFQGYWGRLQMIRLPCFSLDGSSLPRLMEKWGIEVEELEVVFSQTWPPGYPFPPEIDPPLRHGPFYATIIGTWESESDSE